MKEALPIRVHAVQLDIAWEDPPANYARTSALLESADVSPGDLVVLPEMFDTGFSFRTDVTADREGRTLRFLQGLAQKHRITLQGARTVIGPDGRGRNRASVIGPAGEVLVEYDKIHPFSFGRENEFFNGGDRVVVYPWIGGGQGPAGEGAGRGPGPSVSPTLLTVCPAICYDLRFPEIFRQGLLMGAQVYALGANWPLPRARHRLALGIARAIENQAYVICVNRAGSDPHLKYAGGSYVIDPMGEVLLDAGEGEGVLSVEIDPALIASWREKFPAWRDGRLLRPGASV